jgi:hypothetical protein
VQRNKGVPIDSWAYLYNNNYLDDFLVYTNKKYHKYLTCHSLFNNSFYQYIYDKCPKNKIRSTIYDLTEWQSAPEQNSRFGGIEKWKEHKENGQVSKFISEIKAAYESSLEKQNLLNDKSVTIYDPNTFSEYILPLIKQNSDTKFLLFFPPYSIVKYAVDYQSYPNKFRNYTKLVEHVILETEPYPNASVFWFADKDFVKDIGNYKDLTHYSSLYNSMFLDEFSKNNSIINVDNYKYLLSILETDLKKLICVNYLLFLMTLIRELYSIFI